MLFTTTQDLKKTQNYCDILSDFLNNVYILASNKSDCEYLGVDFKKNLSDRLTKHIPRDQQLSLDKIDQTQNICEIFTIFSSYYLTQVKERVGITFLQECPQSSSHAQKRFVSRNSHYYDLFYLVLHDRPFNTPLDIFLSWGASVQICLTDSDDISYHFTKRPSFPDNQCLLGFLSTLLDKKLPVETRWLYINRFVLRVLLSTEDSNSHEVMMLSFLYPLLRFMSKQLNLDIKESRDTAIGLDIELELIYLSIANGKDAGELLSKNLAQNLWQLSQVPSSSSSPCLFPQSRSIDTLIEIILLQKSSPEMNLSLYAFYSFCHTYPGINIAHLYSHKHRTTPILVAAATNKARILTSILAYAQFDLNSQLARKQLVEIISVSFSHKKRLATHPLMLFLKKNFDNSQIKKQLYPLIPQSFLQSFKGELQDYGMWDDDHLQVQENYQNYIASNRQMSALKLKNDAGPSCSPVSISSSPTKHKARVTSSLDVTLNQAKRPLVFRTLEQEASSSRSAYGNSVELG